MIVIRSLLDLLADEDPGAIDRLCDIRGLRVRGRDARCEALARSYRGDHEQFLNDLRKQDLVRLLNDPTEINGTEHYLPSAGNFAKEDLLGMALSLFRDEDVPQGFVALDDEDDDADDEDDLDESDEEDELEDEDHSEHLLHHHRSEKYHDLFWEDLAYSHADASQPLRDYQELAIRKVMASLHAEMPQILHLATGGGKTRVANSLLTRWLAQKGGPVMWVTKDWRLLYQAARDVSRRHQGIKVSRIGGDGSPLHPSPEEGREGIVYSTVQTITRRLSRGVLRRLRPTLLIWDECHWGEHGQAGKVLTACKRAGIPVLGLTATPRTTSRYQVAFSKTFSELVDEGFLARPHVKAAVQTGVHWRPQLRGRFEDVTRASLQELADNRRRNELIVEHYSANAGHYGKTIVFACNIDHVDQLTRLLQSRGIAARGMHSQQEEHWNQRALGDFKTGAVQVLVNMEMLTHGIDVPDANTVFLCRPTTSDILFAQMVGRASRLDRNSGKNSFFVVEFTDNVQEHGHLFTTAQKYFQGSGIDGAPAASHSVSPARVGRTREHGFDPRGAPTWIPARPDLPESVRGLWYREGQTFGIEFELTPLSGEVPQVDQAWMRVAESLRTRLAAVLPGRVAAAVLPYYAGGASGGPTKDSSVWNVEYDSSAGWEVTSRVLSNLEGFIEVDVACRALEEAAAQLGLRVSHRTGTHVHIGWLGQDVGEVKRAIQLTRLFEPALGTLVAPSRLVAFTGQGYDTSQPNAYCRPISSVFSRRVLESVRSLDDIWRIAGAQESRYVTLNLRPLSTLHTVEVRLHHGTIEARKILLWVSLWQQILWAAAHRSPVPDTVDTSVIGPRGDIVRLAQDWLPDARQPQQKVLLQRLAARRTQIVEEQWRRAEALNPWLSAAQNWSAPPS